MSDYTEELLKFTEEVVNLIEKYKETLPAYEIG